MLEVFKDLIAYFKERKKMWLLPIVLILIFIGIIMIFGLVTGLTPFLYPFI
ncbi:MAG: hypothetical protein ACI8ZM_004014 [Crocinitomix sp.]|jgi:hypothetical protein